MGTGALSSRAPWRPASEDESVERVRFGPFLTREVVKRPDGSRLVYSSRRQRKGLPPQVEGAAAPAHRRVIWAPRELGWWVAALFMIGSFCFALGAVPGVSAVLSPEAIGLVFFVGSIFFTSAGYSQFLQSINAGRPPGTSVRLFAVQPRRIDWWACTVQSIGTLWFNVNTFAAMRSGFSTQEELRRVWTPDFLRSLCLLGGRRPGLMGGGPARVAPRIVKDRPPPARSYTVARRYQEIYDPTAHFLSAWLPHPTEVRQFGNPADLTRRPEEEMNITLEVMLVAADTAARAGDYSRANVILDSVENILSNGTVIDPMATSYLRIVRAAAEYGYELQAVELNGNTAQATATQAPDIRLKNLVMEMRGSSWVILSH